MRQGQARPCVLKNCADRREFRFFAFDLDYRSAIWRIESPATFATKFIKLAGISFERKLTASCSQRRSPAHTVLLRISMTTSKTTHPTIAFVNGEFVSLANARVSILDRGFLFADGVYEVLAVVRGRLVDCPSHLARLARSLREMRISEPRPLDELPALMQQLVDREQLNEGLVYLQITRGAPPIRAFHFPNPAEVPPTMVMFVQEMQLTHNPLAISGAKAITVPDIRWHRRDIKSTALLPQVLGKQLAAEAGAFEAWMVEDGYVTEGTSSAACIISHDGTLITRPVSNRILDSITRRAVHRLAAEMSLKIEERLFTPAEAYAAAEAFTASATALIMPIIEIDGHRIGDGKPGKITTRLREIYLRMAASNDPTITEFS